MRKAIVNFISQKILRLKHYSKIPDWLFFLFFPLLFFYSKQSGIKYDIFSNTYYIKGVGINGGILDNLRLSETGDQFTFILNSHKENKIILPSEFYKISSGGK